MNLLRNKSGAVLFALLFALSAHGLKITCVSMSVTNNADANLADMKTLIGTALGELVIFPELALCNFSSGKEQAWVDSAITELRALCLAQKKAVVFGAARKNSGLTYNCAYYINASGALAGTYDQIHAESPYSPGMKIPFFPLQTTEGQVKFGIQIGNDLYVPEPWQFFAENGARCMLLVYLSGLKGAQGAWDKEAHDDLLMAHATDNTVFAAGASQVDPGSLVKSQVMDGAGTVLGSHDPSSPGKVEAQISFLSPGFVMFKRHDEWRRDLYQLVLKNPVASETRRPEAFDPEMRIFPNPFRNSVLLSVAPGTPSIRIYTANGRLVHRISGPPAGEFRWDASGLPAGLYLARIMVKGRSLTRPLFLQK